MCRARMDRDDDKVFFGSSDCTDLISRLRNQAQHFINVLRNDFRGLFAEVGEEGDLERGYARKLAARLCGDELQVRNYVRLAQDREEILVARAPGNWSSRQN